MESILTTIKLLIGITEDCKDFDNQLMVHINAALMRLSQLGVGPKKPVSITSELDTWDKLLLDREDLDGAKTYVYYEVKKTFDPPSSSAALEAVKRESDKLEWCLNIQAEMDEEV